MMGHISLYSALHSVNKERESPANVPGASASVTKVESIQVEMPPVDRAWLEPRGTLRLH